MTRVKVCGVTSVDDALAAVDLGAAMIGLNFYPPSPRFLDIARAVEIVEAVRARRAPVEVVGVFVRESAARIAELDRAAGFDRIQFHGDEEPGRLAPYGWRAIKVWRWRGRPSAEELGAFSSVWGFLVDRKDDERYGGTGESWNFAEAAGLETAKPVLLAGGVGPDNVRAAVAAARPWGVDVCSRVERAPGVKDRALLAALFREIRDGETQSA